MATVNQNSLVRFIPSTSAFIVKIEGKRELLTMEQIRDRVAEGASLSVFSLNFNECWWKRVLGVQQEDVSPTAQFREFRLGKNRYVLHPEALVLTERPIFEVSHQRVDSRYSTPARFIKDGVKIATTSNGRVSFVQVVKAGTRPPANSQFSLLIEAPEAAVFDRNGVIFSSNAGFS